MDKSEGQPKKIVKHDITGTMNLLSGGKDPLQPSNLPDNSGFDLNATPGGTLQLDHTRVTSRKSLKDTKVVVYDEFLDLGKGQEHWVLGQIVRRLTKESVSQRTKYSVNWHSYQVIKSLSGDLNWMPPEGGDLRSINLTPRGLFAILVEDNGPHSNDDLESTRQSLEARQAGLPICTQATCPDDPDAIPKGTTVIETHAESGDGAAGQHDPLLSCPPPMVPDADPAMDCSLALGAEASNLQPQSEAILPPGGLWELNETMTLRSPFHHDGDNQSAISTRYSGMTTHTWQEASIAEDELQNRLYIADHSEDIITAGMSNPHLREVERSEMTKTIKNTLANAQALLAKAYKVGALPEAYPMKGRIKADKGSSDFAYSYWSNKTSRQYVKALSETSRAVRALSAVLNAISMSDDPDDDDVPAKIDIWAGEAEKAGLIVGSICRDIEYLKKIKSIIMERKEIEKRETPQSAPTPTLSQLKVPRPQGTMPPPNMAHSVMNAKEGLITECDTQDRHPTEHSQQSTSLTQFFHADVLKVPNNHTQPLVQTRQPPPMRDPPSADKQVPHPTMPVMHRLNTEREEVTAHLSKSQLVMALPPRHDQAGQKEARVKQFVPDDNSSVSLNDTEYMATQDQAPKPAQGAESCPQDMIAVHLAQSQGKDTHLTKQQKEPENISQQQIILQVQQFMEAFERANLKRDQEQQEQKTYIQAQLKSISLGYSQAQLQPNHSNSNLPKEPNQYSAQIQSEPYTAPISSPAITDITWQITQAIPNKHQWIFLGDGTCNERTAWNNQADCTETEYRENPGFDTDLPTAVNYLINTPISPVWALSPPSSTTLADIIEAQKNLQFAESNITRFLNDKPQNKDDLKTLLKLIHSNNHTLTSDLNKTRNALTKICSRATAFPIALTHALRRKAASSQSLLTKYEDWIQQLKGMQKTQHVMLNPSTMSSSQVQEALKNFSGDTYLTFPEWEAKTRQTLTSSGLEPTSWSAMILKKIVGTARTHLTVEAMDSGDLERTFNDIRAVYSDSHNTVRTLLNLHSKVGIIPDPTHDQALCFKSLTAHNEIIGGMAMFIKYSTATDKFEARDNTFVVRKLIFLLPPRVIQGETLFADLTDCTMEMSKARYERWVSWIKTTRAMLSSISAVAPNDVPSHQVLVSNHNTTEPQRDTDMVGETLKSINSQVQSLVTEMSEIKRNQSTQQGTLQGDKHSTPYPKNCRYCDAIQQSSNQTSKEAYTSFAKHDFMDTHNPWWHVKGSRWMIGPTGCMSFCMISPEERLKVVTAGKHVCKVCLAVPNNWDHGMCKGRHVISIRREGKHKALCMHPSCEFHFLICTRHAQENANHPHKKICEDWIASQHTKMNFQSPPHLIMMAQTPQLDHTLPQDFLQILAMQINISQNLSTMMKRYQDSHGSLAGTFRAPLNLFDGDSTVRTEQDLARAIPQPLQSKISHARNILLTNDIPLGDPQDSDHPTIMYSKQELLNSGMKDEVILERPGEALYLFLDMLSMTSEPVRVVFDTGASISLFLASCVQAGKLRLFLDLTKQVTVGGIGNTISKAQSAQVILPGNKRNMEGQYESYITLASIVQKIVPDLKKVNIQEDVKSALREAQTIIDTPADMTLENFQHEVGSRIEGLIGARNMQDYPQVVLWLSMGVGIFRHTLAPHGNRSRVYCIGGNRRVIDGVAGAMGKGWQDAMMAHLNDINEHDYQFDGDYTDKTLRFPSNYEEWGSESRHITQGAIMDGVTSGSNSDCFFRAPASPPSLR